MLCFSTIASKSYLDSISSISGFPPLREAGGIGKLSALKTETFIIVLCKLDIIN